MEMHDRNIGAFFDECARNGFMESFSTDEEPKLEELFSLWNIKHGHRILEPGCGSGRLTELISEAVAPSGMVYACDLSEEMIRRACARKLPENVRFVRGSVEKIQVDDTFFDIAICFSVFPHFSDPSHALTEIHRVLKPGGHFWINHLKDSTTLNELHRNAGSVIIAHHNIPEAKEMKQLLAQNGFSVLRLLNSPETGYCLHAVKIQPTEAKYR